jgi:O-antigen/teichoic acid export membrane protein
VFVHHRALRRLGVRLDRAALSIRSMVSTMSDTAVLGVTVVVLMALFRLDAVLLRVFKDTTALAHYAVPYRLFESTLFLTYSVQGATFAVMAGARERSRVGAEAARAVYVAGLAYALFLGTCLVDAPAILRVFGGQYEHASAGALRWLAAAPLCYVLAALASSGLQAVRRRRDMLVAAVTALLVNIAINLVAIPAFGGTGAAMATTVSYAVQAGVALALLRRAGVHVPLRAVLVAPLTTAAAVAGLLAVCPWPPLVEIPLTLALVFAVWAAIFFRRNPGGTTLARRLGVIGQKSDSSSFEAS